MSFKYIHDHYVSFEKVYNNLISNDEKVIAQINKSNKEFDFMEKMYIFSKELPFRGDDNRRIFMTECSWRDIAVSCETLTEKNC